MTRTLVPKISLNDLAARWGWKPERLYHLCAEKRMPHLKIGGRIYFEEPALETWLEAQRAETAADKQARTRDEECRALGIEPNHSFT